MTTRQWVLVEDDGAVRVMTMNRPEARNALNVGLIESLYAALCEADAEPSVRAVVLTGVDPAFCAGVDLKEAQREGMSYFERYQTHNCITKVAEIATPMIGAINGPDFTEGLEMALGCDFLIASERAVFADTHARVGFLPGGGMTARLPQLVGAAMARRLSMTGEVIDASRAGRIGLVTEVVPHDRLMARAVELAAQVAEVPGPTMAALKKTYVTGADHRQRAGRDGGVATGAHRRSAGTGAADLVKHGDRQAELRAVGPEQHNPTRAQRLGGGVSVGADEAHPAPQSDKRSAEKRVMTEGIERALVTELGVERRGEDQHVSGQHAAGVVGNHQRATGGRQRLQAVHAGRNHRFAMGPNALINRFVSSGSHFADPWPETSSAIFTREG